jgi:hypothetical protein
MPIKKKKSNTKKTIIYQNCTFARENSKVRINLGGCDIEVHSPSLKTARKTATDIAKNIQQRIFTDFSIR